MPKFIMLVGLPAVGKDTWAREYIKTHTNTVIHSSDDIREELYGDASCQDNPQKVFEMMRSRAVKSLQEGKDVIYNATNLKYKNRRSILTQVKKQTNATCHCKVFVAPVEVCKERNMARERKVPEYVYDKMLRSFEVPFENEGFDSIEIIKTWDGSGTQYKDEIVKKVKAFGDQKNPHHTLSLWEHCEKCFKSAINENPFIVVASAIHDYGKIFTQTFDANGVAHYYGHAETSSYLSLCFGYSILVAQLVNYHMLFFQEGATAIWRTRLGENLWSMIETLHKYDELAH